MIFPRISAHLTRFSRRSPLWGKRILITRAAGQSDTLLRLLAARGATPMLYPCIAITPLENPAPLDAAILEAISGAFDTVILTSVNTVEQINARLKALCVPSFVFSSLRIAAVGAATAQKIDDLWGIQPHLIPERYDAASLAALPAIQTGSRVFLPQSDRAKTTLASALAARGVEVRAVTAYRTRNGSGGIKLAETLAARGVDIITFASPSAVSGFFARLQAENIPNSQLTGIRISCIGASTRRAAEDAGLPVHITPPNASLAEWVTRLEDYYRV